MSATFDPDAGRVPPPDPSVAPAGYVVVVQPNDRIHFLDWGGPGDARGVLLVHGIGQTAWVWTPVARRLVGERRVVAMDLRGHGLSDAPTEGYDERTLIDDVVAVADGSGLLARPVVLVGHGFGGVVAAWAAAALRDRCAGLVLVDGGWEDLPAATGLEPDEFLRGLDEPPEVLRSMAAFLADRAAFDPATWDADQEQAARATVVETQAGRVVPSTRPHALAGVVGALFDYRPLETLGSTDCPVVALVAAEDDAATRRPALRAANAVREATGRSGIRVVDFPADGHNLMRYRPDAVTAAVLAARA